MHLSLWLRPEGETRARIIEVMRRLRERGGGPAFEPHVTLLGGIEAEAADAGSKLERLTARIRPITLALGRIDWREERFRCLFAVVAPSAELAAARRAAVEVFGVVPAGPYEPHLSLLYGEIDAALKRELAAAAGGGLDLSFEAAAVELVDTSRNIPVERWRTLAARACAAGSAPHSSRRI